MSINVLIVPAWYDHKNKSSGIFIHEFCEVMHNENNTNITLLYLDFFPLKNFIAYFFQKKPIINTNYKIIYVKSFNLKSKLFFFLSNKFILNNYFKKVIKKIKDSDENFNIIHIQSLCNNVTPFIAVRTSEQLKIPYILTEHYTSYMESKGAIFKPFLSEKEVIHMAENAKARVAVSDFAANIFYNYFNCSFQTIYNTINPIFFKESNHVVKRENFTFISIGGLDSRKGFMEILYAFNKLYQVNKTVQLIIIGEGDLNDNIIDFIDIKKLKSVVELHGWMNKKKLIEFLDISHVLISASEMETFGLTVAEANLRGLPVIATKSGGPGELINDSNGILIDLTNKKEILFKAMLNITLNYPMYSLDRIRIEAIRKFDNKNVVNSYTNLYNNYIKTVN